MSKILVAPEYRIATGYLRKEGLSIREYKIVLPEGSWSDSFRGRSNEEYLLVMSPLYRKEFLDELEVITRARGFRPIPVEY